jgi:hypothetical protein
LGCRGAFAQVAPADFDIPILGQLPPAQVPFGDALDKGSYSLASVKALGDTSIAGMRPNFRLYALIAGAMITFDPILRQSHRTQTTHSLDRISGQFAAHAGGN